MGEFLYGVNTGSLEQLCELRADTLYTVEVSVIGPFENEFVGNAGGLCEFLSALWGCAFFKKLLSCVDTCCNEFFGVCRSDAFYIDNLVSHTG